MPSIFLLAFFTVPLVESAITYESFLVDSVVVARYARTTITSVIFNPATTSGEVTFTVKLPRTAFISNFTMEINGTAYIGIAKDKESAAEEFERRKEDGQNVGLVESRGTSQFQIRANTAAESRSSFTLTYEELITRTLSKYQQTISLDPGSVVNDLRVTVRVIDSQGVKTFNTSSFVSSNRISNDEVQFSYSPSVAQQNDGQKGLSRDMVIEFDVNQPTDMSAGLIIVNDCFFAQFFSPGNIAPIPVDIVFVIDTSGSMSGKKIMQARESLVEIISQLSNEDRYTIVTFSSLVATWRNSLVSVGEYREQGKSFASGLEADGGTNFNEGLVRGIEILKSSGNSNYVQLLVMLSDGEPTTGVVDHDMIVNGATRLVSETRISLNMLGFGVNLNLLLLQRIAIANRGVAKQIFEGEDAAAQLRGFYESISSPILHSLNFNYPTSDIETISDVTIPLLFQGSEVVVAGRFTESACVRRTSIPVSVSGMGVSSSQTFSSQVDPATQTVIAGIKPDTERLVAYLSVQQMLSEFKVATNDSDTNTGLRQKALNLALRYNFVTELTSLIVVEEAAYNDSVSDYKTIVEPQDTISDKPNLAPGILNSLYSVDGESQSSALSSSISVIPIIIAVVVVVSLAVVVTLGTIVAVIVVMKKKKQTYPQQQATQLSFASPLAMNPETNSEITAEVKEQEEATMTDSREILNATPDATWGNMEEDDSKWKLIDQENSEQNNTSSADVNAEKTFTEQWDLLKRLSS